MSRKPKKTEADEERFKTVLERIGPEFIRESAERIGVLDFESLVAQLDQVEEQFETGDALRRFKKQSELLVGLLRDYHAGDYRTVSYWTLSVIVFALGYVLKPIDIIPDSLPVIGQLDDALVVSHCLAMLEKDLHAYEVWSMARDASGS